MTFFEIFSAVLALLGAFFVFVAGVGIWKFRDIYMRMHAATKAGSLGLGLLLAQLRYSLPIFSHFFHKTKIKNPIIYL